MKRPRCFAGAFFVFLAILAVPSESSAQNGDPAAWAQLGKRLFMDKRLSNPGSRFEASCASCHIPESFAGLGRRYADVLPLSLVPSSQRGFKNTTLRNAPALLDVVRAPRLGWDGRFQSLEEVVRWKLDSLHLGWLPSEKEMSLDEMHITILLDSGDQVPDTRAFSADFKEAFNVEIESLSREQIRDYVVHALVAFVQELTSTYTSPFDRLLAKHDVDPERVATPEEWSDAMGAIADRGDVAVEGFSALAVEGMRIFFRSTGEAHVGNCVACHAPPHFSDFDFHATGVEQTEYDGVHGEGAFVALGVPGTSSRPSAAFLSHPSADDVTQTDLGHWNYASGENVEGQIAAFKTPSLRNVKYTNPYMHNGAYETLEEAVRQKIAASRLARKGTLRNASPALAEMRLSEEDVAPLVAFLSQLNEEKSPGWAVPDPATDDEP